MRIAPRPLVGLVACVGYQVIVYGALLGSMGLPYTIRRWAYPGLFAILLCSGAVFLILVTRYAGWWRPVMKEEPRTAPRWTMAVTALYLVAGVVALATSGVFTLGASRTLPIASFSVLLGFSYLILYQGLLLVGLRGSVPEGGVWILTSLMFAFPAMFFAFVGGPTSFSDYPETIGLWFLGGTALYVVRMAQGSLAPAMGVYALWNFAVSTTLASEGTRHVVHGPSGFVKGLSPVEGLTFCVMVIVTLVAVWQTVRAKNAAIPAKPLPVHVTSEK